MHRSHKVVAGRIIASVLEIIAGLPEGLRHTLLVKRLLNSIVDLFLEYFISELDDLDKNNVCIRIMGDMSAFPVKMGQEPDEAMY